jgi:peptide/nickel transport system permease protein
VTYKYALKNACIPTITLLGLGIGRLLGNAVLVEIVFARPGLGRLIYNAISERNYPIVQGASLVVVVLFVAVNLIVDLSVLGDRPAHPSRHGETGGRMSAGAKPGPKGASPRD